jgi:hypothetical protein
MIIHMDRKPTARTAKADPRDLTVKTRIKDERVHVYMNEASLTRLELESRTERTENPMRYGTSELDEE